MLSAITTEEEFSDLRYGYGTIGKPFILDLMSEDKQGRQNSIEVTVLEDAYVDSSRWTEIHRLVWKEAGQDKILAVYYEVPATENQEGSERDYDPSEVFVVIAQEITIVQYTQVSNKAPEDMGA